MGFIIDESTVSSVIASFKSMIHSNYASIEALQQKERFSVLGINHLNSLKFSTLQMSRLCNMIEFLINSDKRLDHKDPQNFDVLYMLQDILDIFNSSISGCMDVSATLSVNLKDNFTLFVDKSKFELIILNLLYCCIKKRPDHKHIPVKIQVSVTENKDNFVFHIKDNQPPLDYDIIDSISTNALPDFDVLTEQSFATLVSLSLRVAHKSATQLNGTVVCKPLKNGNKFDFYIPKFAKVPVLSVNSIAPYIPTHHYYSETFAEIKLEHLLEEICKNLEECTL